MIVEGPHNAILTKYRPGIIVGYCEKGFLILLCFTHGSRGLSRHDPASAFNMALNEPLCPPPPNNENDHLPKLGVDIKPIHRSSWKNTCSVDLRRPHHVHWNEVLKVLGELTPNSLVKLKAKYYQENGIMVPPTQDQVDAFVAAKDGWETQGPRQGGSGRRPGRR